MEKLRRNVRYLIELRAVRSLFCEVFDRVVVRRMLGEMYLIELRAVKEFVREWRGIR